MKLTLFEAEIIFLHIGTYICMYLDYLIQHVFPTHNCCFHEIFFTVRRPFLIRIVSLRGHSVEIWEIIFRSDLTWNKCQIFKKLEKAFCCSFQVSEFLFRRIFACKKCKNSSKIKIQCLYLDVLKWDTFCTTTIPKFDFT